MYSVPNAPRSVWFGGAGSTRTVCQPGESSRRREMMDGTETFVNQRHAPLNVPVEDATANLL